MAQTFTQPNSIFAHTVLVGENHIVKDIGKLLGDETFTNDELTMKLTGEQFDEHQPILVITDEKRKSYYTPAQKRANIKYRETHRAQYNESQRKLFEKYKQDEDWVKKRNEMAKHYNKKHAERRASDKITAAKAEAVAKGVEYVPEVKRGRGRPRKEIVPTEAKKRGRPRKAEL